MNRCLINAPNVSALSRWGLFCGTFGLVCLSGLSAQSFDVDRALTISQASPSQPSNSVAAGERMGRAILRSGSRGTDVNELQATLRLLGFYDGAVDGFFGDSTVAAVGRFQEAAGVGKDGIVGPATWERLFPPDVIVPTPTVTPRAPDLTRSGETTPKPQPAVAPTSAAFPILRKGMSGDAVRGLQERLRSLGVFEGTIDGAFGEATETAVKAAQRKYQLDPDGVVGPGTWSAILR